MPARAVDDGDAVADLARLILAMPPAELERFVLTLDPDDVALVEQIVADHAAAGWRSDPATMAAFLDPRFQIFSYVRLLSRKFKEACDGVSTRQIWNVQGRIGKSLLAQWGVAWQLDRRPESRFILNSYAKKLAVENAVGVRDRLRQYSQVLRCDLSRDRQAMDRFTTSAGGGVLASGRGSVVRGFGAGDGGGVIIDDPFRDWQEAHSEATRDLVFNQIRGTLFDRLDDEQAFILVVMQRVHQFDLTGKLLEDAAADEWDMTVLPALAVEGRPDPLGRQPGESIEPARFSVAFIEAQTRRLGSYLASSLLQQNPVPEEGNDVRRAWFRLWGTEDNPLPTVAQEKMSSWDLKLKNREQGDYVVGQVWWRSGAEYFLRDQLRGQYDHATTANAIALLAVRNPDVQQHVIEAAGAADEVVPMLRQPKPDYIIDDQMAGRLSMTDDEREAVQELRRRGMSGLVFHPVTEGSKEVRARAFIVPFAEAGNVHLPAYAEWTPALLDELSAFPKGQFDDQVDAMSQALQRLSRLGATVTAPTRRTPTPTPGQGPTLIRTVNQPRGSAVSLPVRRPGRRR